MARIARAVAPGYPHHVTQRGNYQQNIFKDEEDYRRYKSWLEEYSRKEGLRIWAYCLMTNHVHLLVVPRRKKAMDLAIGRTHMRHARRVNREQGWSGHLWANRFYSTILDETHLWAAVRYIERNPVRAGLVKRAERYGWSSARCHAKGVADTLLSARRPFREAQGIADWSAWLAEGGDVPCRALVVGFFCSVPN